MTGKSKKKKASNKILRILNSGFFFHCSLLSSTLRDPLDCSMPGSSVLHYLNNAIQPSHHLPPPSPPTLSLSHHQGLFQWALHIRWPKYWSFSFNISPSNEYSGLISFRTDWLDLLGTFKSLLQHQHHSLKVLVLQNSAFFMFQPSVFSFILMNKCTLLMYNIQYLASCSQILESKYKHLLHFAEWETEAQKP